ncbi:hypothetical protein ACFWIP_21885 [Streptomyces anulatus]|uniref:hypothetical protein n=1 Tax=Streptomyces anulatus TaxID=1892 RepID=UPI00365C7CBD
MVTAQDVGGRVTDGKRIGVLKDFDPKWTDPASMPNERTHYPQAWVYFQGAGERQCSPEILERVPR